MFSGKLTSCSFFPRLSRLHEIVANPAASAAPSTGQAPTVTTYWVETVLGSGVTTWVEVVYTQTFEAVPSQGPEALSGSVGLGTLTGKVGAVKTQAVGTESEAMRTKTGYGMGSLLVFVAGVGVVVGVAMG